MPSRSSRSPRRTTDALGLQGCGGRVGPGQPDDLVARSEQFVDGGGADPAGRSGDEDAHGVISFRAAGERRCQSQTYLHLHVSRCHHYSDGMARWDPGAPERLQEAALELFATRGFEQTTAAEIAQSVGLTERTFFRHFSDKREVLFSGQHQLAQAFLAGVDAAPPGTSPIEVVACRPAVRGVLLPGRSPVALPPAPVRDRPEPRAAGTRAAQARHPRHDARRRPRRPRASTNSRPRWRRSRASPCSGSRSPSGSARARNDHSPRSPQTCCANCSP